MKEEKIHHKENSTDSIDIEYSYLNKRKFQLKNVQLELIKQNGIKNILAFFFKFPLTD